MQRSGGVTARVAGAPVAQAYRSVDLGHDRHGALVLSYRRCSSFSRCVARRDDLRGHRASFRGLVPRGCALSSGVAVWKARVAYGLECRDARRTGLYVSGHHLPRPPDAVRFGARQITAVDLRGARVAAVASDVYEYAFVETVAGNRMASFLAAASEGDSDEHVRGLALGTGGALWALTDAEHAGDPEVAVVHRLAGDCDDWQTLDGARDGMAVDGSDVYLLAGGDVAAHPYAPEHPC
jgi:hypothetical protein